MVVLLFHIFPSSLRTKLDDISEKCIFIGYSEKSKAYKLYNLKTKKIAISKDVHFDEKSSSDFSDFLGSSNWQLLEFKENESQPSQHDDQRIESPQNSPWMLGRSTRSLREIYDEIEVNAANQIFFAFFVEEDQITYEEESKEEKRIQAMNEEMNAIEKNDTWKLIDLPSKKFVIGVKWVFKIKTYPDGSINKYKAKLVAKGYKQKKVKILMRYLLQFLNLILFS